MISPLKHLAVPKFLKQYKYFRINVLFHFHMFSKDKWNFSALILSINRRIVVVGSIPVFSRKWKKPKKPFWKSRMLDSQPPPQALRFRMAEASAQREWLVMNRKGPWEGYRRWAKLRAKPVVSFSPSFARTSKERRLGTRQLDSSLRRPSLHRFTMTVHNKLWSLSKLI